MRALTFLASTFFSALVWAADKEQAAVGGARTPITSGTIYEAVGGLVVVILLILALGWGFRKFTRLPLAGRGSVTVLGGVSLGARERAVLLQVGETQLLVGVAPGRVQTLHVLDEPLVEDDAKQASDGFSQKLKQALNSEASK